MKIACLIPYYGRWPSYFPIYLDSLSKNGWMDVVFISDLKLPSFAPKNAKIIHLTKVELIRKVEEAVELTPNLENPYKLCDLRPSFGKVFGDFLDQNRYDFWGWGDIDLIYGDISQFFSMEDFEENDVLSGRENWVSGGLTFLRNTQIINNLFLQNDDYKSIFSSPKHFSYSECGKVWERLRQGESILDMKFEYSNFTQFVWESSKNGQLKIKSGDYFKEALSSDQYVHVCNGISGKNKERYLLYHFITEKRSPWFNYPKWETAQSDFYVTQTGFYKSSHFNPRTVGLINFIKKMGYPRELAIRQFRALKQSLKRILG